MGRIFIKWQQPETVLAAIEHEACRLRIEMLIFLKIYFRGIQECTCTDVVRKMFVNTEFHLLPHANFYQIEPGIAPENS